MAHGVGIVRFTIILLKAGFLVCLRQFQWHGIQSILVLQLGRIGIFKKEINLLAAWKYTWPYQAFHRYGINSPLYKTQKSIN